MRAQVLFKYGFRALLVLALHSCTCNPNEGVAKVLKVEGEVTVIRDGIRAPLALTTKLQIGDTITTGSDGRTTLGFRGGNIIEVSPNTTFVIQSADLDAGLQTMVTEGSVKARSSGTGILLSVGTPYGLAEIGQRVSEIVLSLDRGLEVLVGAVTVVTDAGRQQLEEGQGLSVDGVVLELGDRSITVAPIELLLLSKSKKVRVREAEDQPWKKADPETPLKKGYGVRTARDTGSVIQVGERGEIEMGRRTQLEIEEDGSDAANPHPTYRLTSGRSVTRLNEEGAQADLIAGGRKLAIKASSGAADVEVTRDKKHLQVAVRRGSVELDNGDRLQAGTMNQVPLEEGEVKTQSLGVVPVRLEEARTTTAYFERSLPALKFEWKERPGTMTIEIANKADFSSILVTERVSGDSFGYDRAKPGTLHVRVSDASGVLASQVVHVRRYRPNDCQRCKRNNTVEDNGEQTVVYFQRKIPIITFTWRDKGPHLLKIYKEPDFDNVYYETTATRRATVPAGRLGEGTYYWLAEAKGAKGGGATNTLKVVYDNAVDNLVIASPNAQARLRFSAVMTRGTVPLGRKLWVMGSPARLDGKGRFSRRVPLDKGQNILLYRTRTSDGHERIYLREVYRVR